MALRVLMLRRSIENKRTALAALDARDAEFATREAELEAAIAEAATDEEMAAVDAELESFESTRSAHHADRERLAGELADLETQLAAAEAATRSVPESGTPNNERNDNRMEHAINIRSLPMGCRAFDALPVATRENLTQREDVQQMLRSIRSAGSANRSVTGAELTVPTVILELISENMYRYSKLLNRVRVRNVSGVARQTVAGTVPEAVWTEMCGAINELTIGFNQISVDGYKVAGFIAICNSLLEDSDIELTAAIVEMLSESVAIAEDKAILYGRGSASRMPLGIVTRLAQQSKPADYPANAPAWVNLSASNIVSIPAAKTGAEFWAELTTAAGNIYNRYARGEVFWAMNSKTHAMLKSKAITFTATGDVVANVYNVLPVITGNVDILEFMPDGDIVGGYGDLYLWAQRAGMTIEPSREVQFLQDNTVFKGKKRADGEPIVPGAFVAININGQAPTTAMTFAADVANDAQLSELNVGASLGAAFDPAVLAYTATASAASNDISATPAQAGAAVSISVNGKNVNNGGTATWKTGANTVAVTVKKGNAVRVYTVTVTKS